MRWNDQGRVIHYISSSPWPSFEDLAARLTLQGLPSGVPMDRCIPPLRNPLSELGSVSMLVSRRIPAALACYWLGRSELGSSQRAEA